MFNFIFKAGLLRWRGYAFLAGVDHGCYDMIKETRRHLDVCRRKTLIIALCYTLPLLKHVLRCGKFHLLQSGCGDV